MENKDLITKAMDYAKRNAVCAGITVQDIASHAGFSIDYFNRMFLSYTGFSVMAYVNNHRLKHAATLLQQTDTSLLDIALDVGYNSHEGFIKAFKKKYGLTPSQYRNKMKNQIPSIGLHADSAALSLFLHDHPDFQSIEEHHAIDYLLEKDAMQYCYICGSLLHMGLSIAAPGGNAEAGFVLVGDNGKCGYSVELVTGNLSTLAAWLRRFPETTAFYSMEDSNQVLAAPGLCDIASQVSVCRQYQYAGTPLACDLPESIRIRPLCAADCDAIRKWAGSRNDTYIRHLLNPEHYRNEAVLEYGVFRENQLIAVAGCGIEVVHDCRFNDCCIIRFAENEENEALYRPIYTYVTNEILKQGMIACDTMQQGAYAASHGDFTTAELGFKLANQKFIINT